MTSQHEIEITRISLSHGEVYTKVNQSGNIEITDDVSNGIWRELVPDLEYNVVIAQ